MFSFNSTVLHQNMIKNGKLTQGKLIQVKSKTARVQLQPSSEPSSRTWLGKVKSGLISLGIFSHFFFKCMMLLNVFVTFAHRCTQGGHSAMASPFDRVIRCQNLTFSIYIIPLTNIGCKPPFTYFSQASA